ncbi:MAG: PIN domain-containing protein [Chloroflexi bacterium]|nr:MAG: PIN domain-containing protein [Chloroflexota bacterium]
MRFYYLDSSALVKCYVAEPGSHWVRWIVVAPDTMLYSSDLAIAEVAAALAILGRTGHLSRRQQREALAEFYKHTTTRFLHLPASRATIRYAADLTQQYPLKGYDAVHLATALALAKVLRPAGLVLTLVTGDRQMIHAAQAEGLPVENPFDHAHLDAEER